MADDAPNQDLPENAGLRDQDLPERLRVHSLARVLGTTSRRVLDALRELDGRSRSPHSSVDKSDAVRVRDVLAAEAVVAAPEAPVADVVAEVAPVVEEAADESVPAELVVADEEPVVADVVADDEPDVAEVVVADELAAEEPESRLMLEPVVEVPNYLPLFVAPQPYEPVPVAPKVDETVADDSDDSDGDEDDDADADDSDGDQSERPNRRRRRGRRGRGRGRGADASDADDKDRPEGDDKADDTAEGETSDDESDDSDDDAGDDDQNSAEGATRRRRRRRRRKGGGGDGDGDSASSDDPPNTVVHERSPRSSKDNNEIQGISGSTRLEAKRQRRRDGRDAGRRRPPILTEAEFLARREAVERVMVVRDKIRTEAPHEGARYTQIAVLEDGVLVEHFVTSAGSASLVGNVYLGIVQNVLPSMEAAFVDIGRGRNGVLYAGEVNWEAAGLGGANRRIEQALSPGDYVVVQVSKDPVGHKGARLTTQVSLAGRYLVYVPGASSTGISRKLPDTERQRLKEVLREVVPADAGVIIRTASEGVKEEDIRADVSRLQERWSAIDERAKQIKGNAAGAAVALYEEPDVLIKVIRDLFNEDFSGLIVSGDEAWKTISDYVNSVAPDLVSKLNKYQASGPDGGPDVFAVHRIDEQLAKAMDRKVWLPSGGSLVIDRTEAMTVVDVNTGKFTGSGGNLEQTVTKNNLEAAEEVVRQLRLRDIGGIVVVDFIDMVLESNRDLVLRRLTEALARDRTRHQVSEVTSLGLVQLTRKKLGTGLVEAFSTTCTHCGGRGIVLHGDPVDSAPAQSRGPAGKSDSTSRRGKRAKKGKAEEAPPVSRVPSHSPGEHPMFKAMAAANGKHEPDEDSEDALDEDVIDDSVIDYRSDEAAESGEAVEDQQSELDEAFIGSAVDDSDEDDSDDDDSDDDDSDEDDSDEDDDLDLVDSDEDDADDEDSDEDDFDDDDDSDDEDDEDDEDEDSDEDDEDDEDEDLDEDSETDYDPDGRVSDSGVTEADERASAVAVVTTVRRPRRRAAARPAGPPAV